jgi:hypothetical protein
VGAKALGSRFMESGEHEVGIEVREVGANGVWMKTTEVEAKLDEGNIQEAESSLREGLSLNFEVRMFLSSEHSCIFIFYVDNNKQLNRACILIFLDK